MRGIIPGNDVFFNVSLRPGVSVVQGLFLEMFLTTELVFTILMLAAEKTKATFVAPVGIGLALFVAELVGVYWTGGALNPARAFGPQVVVGNFPGTHWVYCKKTRSQNLAFAKEINRGRTNPRCSPRVRLLWTYQIPQLRRS